MVVSVGGVDSVDELQSKGSWLMYLTIGGVLLGGVSLGLVMGYASPAVPSMEATSNLSRIHYNRKTDEEVETWIRSIPNIGAIVGGLSGGYLAGLRGRKICIMATSIPLFVGWILVGTATNSAMIVSGRLITGICCGVFTASIPTYISELSPIHMRGSLGTCFQLSAVIGVFLSSAFGKFASWSALAFISTFPVVLMPVILFFGVESPVYLFNKYGNCKITLGALEKLRTSCSNVQREMDVLARSPQERQPMLLKWSQIKVPGVYLPLLYTWGLMVFQQASGINAVLFNEKDIFLQSKIEMDPDVCSIILNAIQVLATVGSSFISDRFGRKVLLMVSGVGNTLSLFVLGLFFLLASRSESFSGNFGWLALLSLVSYLSFFAIGYGPIPWLMGPELSPYYARGFILSSGTVINWGMAFLITKEFENLEKLLKPAGTFLLFTFISLLGVLFTTFFLPETRGRTSEEIQELYKGKSSPSPSPKKAPIARII